MTAPGLFPEPERVDVPTMDGHWSIAPRGWRDALLGEDGQYLVVQGHVRDDALADVLAALPNFYGSYGVDDVSPERTWVRELTACPTHRPDDGDAQAWCGPCHARPDDPWWDWSTPDSQPDANRHAEGYFPATVIDLEVG